MKKMMISEERLQNLLKESIYEILSENNFGEGIGHLLGKTYQNTKDIESGRDETRYSNNDYNAYSKYSNKENEIKAHPALINQQSQEKQIPQTQNNNKVVNNSYKYKMNGAYLKAENNKVLQQLNAAGLEPEYKNGKIINIKSKNGKISPEQRSIIQQIKRNPAYTRMMFENKLQTLKQELNEIKKRLK